MGTSEISSINFYAKRANEDGATFVGQYTTQGAIMIGENMLFKKHAAKYFADNTALVAKIENKDYKITDIVAVVNEYNQWKQGKK